jgi:SAM-dependent methyltransferase
MAGRVGSAAKAGESLLAETADQTHHEQALGLYEAEDTVAYWATQTELLPVEQHLFGRYLRPGMRILDMGVGAGRTTPYLSELAGPDGHYEGLDYAEGMVEVCRQRFPDLTFHHADAADLSRFDDASFDAVIFSFGGIDYVTPADRRRQCLAESRRVLRPGGTFMISRHNPRAVVRLPGRPGQDGSPVRWQKAVLAVPAWAVRRASRLVPTRAFWSGEGGVVEPPYGFNAPLLRSARARLGAKDGTGILTEMATPHRVRQELRGAGFTPVATEGAAYPHRTWSLTTNWYYYVATRP